MILKESIWTYKVKEGQKAKLYVDVKASSGEKIKYNWQKYDNEENTYISIDNTTDTYTTDAISSEEGIAVLLPVMVKNTTANL
ncbi:MAG: hypothetical protein ACLTS6_09830 [Anaerobutyricum sp.]